MGGARQFGHPLGERGLPATLSLARVGACVDELHLMGVERDEVPIEVGRAFKAEGSLSRKSPRACRPPAMERV